MKQIKKDIKLLLNKYFKLSFEDNKENIKLLQDAIDILQNVKEYKSK